MIGLGEFDETLGWLEDWLESVFSLMSQLCLVLVRFGGAFLRLYVDVPVCSMEFWKMIRTYLILC